MMSLRRATAVLLGCVALLASTFPAVAAAAPTPVQAYAYPITDYDADILLTRKNLDRYWQTTTGKGTYTAPGVSWLNEAGGTSTGCGNVERQDAPNEGAFYCPADKVIYLDYTYLRYVTSRYGYDGLMATVAHEYGHHIQNLFDLKTPSRKAREWQADCFGGAAMRWMAEGFTRLSRSELGLRAYDTGDNGVDDENGYSHGTGAQRQTWFLYGWDTGAVACRDAS
jgi:predicted metalloprotease